MKRQLVIMVKAPVMGRVKTRLGREIGQVEATRFFRVALERLVRRLNSPKWQTILAVSPDESLLHWPWPEGVYLATQGAGDLGARMQRMFDELPCGPVVIIGSDIPAITPAHIEKAFAALGRSDAVIGPAPDGGYWLIGLKRRPNIPRAFENVRWSSPSTLADTLLSLKRQKVSRIDTLEDVDDAAAYKRWL